MPVSIGFATPVHVARPILPCLTKYSLLLGEIWESGQLTNDGVLLRRLRQRLSHHLVAPHLTLLGSGTLALQLAIAAFELKGEVITPAFTFAATPHALSWAGITPVFADIDPKNLTIDPYCVEKAITPKTSAILAVHIYGMPCDVQALAEIAERHGLRLLYDGAHAFNSSVDGEPIGNFGDATALSFHATKLFHSAEGGALIVRDPNILHRVESLQNFGLSKTNTVEGLGINAKMNELEAAMGLLVLDQIAEEQTLRKAVSATYRKRFEHVRGLSILVQPRLGSDLDQYAVLLVDAKETGVSSQQLCAKLARFNIFPRRYFSQLCSDFPHYKSLPTSDPGNLPVSTRISQQVMCLPFYGELGSDGADQVADAILHLLG